MHKFVLIFILAVATFAAQTQEEIYMRALVAEKDGNIALALKTFEEAAKLAGPYTAEINEIINDYYNAIGEENNQNENEFSKWSFRFLGETSFYELLYNETKSSNEYGNDMFFSLSPFVDFSTANFMHSFGLILEGDWFINNDDIPVLDTSDFNFTLGLEYSLISETIFLDVGVDFNFANETSQSFYLWAQKDFWHKGKKRLGAAAWAYYNTDGPLYFALYITLNKNKPYGFNWNTYIGARFEADSVVNYTKYAEQFANQNYAEILYDDYSPFDNFYGNDPFGYCMQNYGEQCLEFSPQKIDSLFYANMQDSSTTNIYIPRYFAKRMGPTLRAKLSYKFRTNITAEILLNTFYGFTISAPDSDYKKANKLNIKYGSTIYWRPNLATFYIGFSQLYRHYNFVNDYASIYSRNSLLTEFKAGVKFAIP